jgi:hypothetical protein
MANIPFPPKRLIKRLTILVGIAIIAAVLIVSAVKMLQVLAAIN